MLTDDRCVVVVGSGPAGATAATRLVRCGIPVIMLESGREMPRGLLVRAAGRDLYTRWPALMEDMPYVASGDPATRWANNLVPGGLSNYWGGVIPRFAPEDFSEGQRLDRRYQWPVSYDDLLPFYEQLEAELGVSGGVESVAQLPAPKPAYRRQLPAAWQRIAAQARAAGHGVTAVPRARGRAWLTQPSAAPFNSYAALISRLSRSSRFRLVLDAHASRIECRSGKRATHVVYFDRNAGCERRIQAAAVVLAAGPLGSTKLLLDSTGVPFPGGLGNIEGVLGRYLHDHSLATLSFTLARPIAGLPDGAYLTRAAYHESPPLLGGALLIGTSPSKAARFLPALARPSEQISYALFGTVIPSEDRFVCLDAQQKDQFGLPRLTIHMHFTAEEQQNLARAKQRFVDILESAGHRCVIPGPEPVAQPPGSSMHFGGTIRMHASPRYGMADGWGRLHAVQNVVIADAAAFTTGVEKNPTLTVMALAARAAERLALDLKAA